VVHAAGLIQDQLLMQMELETFRTVLRPKVHGAWALHRATQDLALDFFVLFSSITAILGQFGQANYAAGNAFMDALAHYRRAQGLPACSINWGPWSGVGMFARLQTSGQDTALGIDTIAPEQGLQVLEYLLARHTVQVSVAGADWRRFPRSPLLSTLSSPEAVAGASAPEPGDTTALLELLLTDISERKSLLESKLCEVTAQVFREEPDQIDVSKPLISLGMDSLMAVELKNRVERTFNLQVSMVDLFTGSISRLAEHLMSQLQADDGLADLFTQVEDLSMDEVNKLLDQGDV
jgi:acyl carrier protein